MWITWEIKGRCYSATFTTEACFAAYCGYAKAAWLNGGIDTYDFGRSEG